MDANERACFMHGLVESELRDRIQAVKCKGKCDSLFMAMMDVQLHMYNQAYHTLVEAVEDAESVK